MGGDILTWSRLVLVSRNRNSVGHCGDINSHLVWTGELNSLFVSYSLTLFVHSLFILSDAVDSFFL